MFGKNKDHTPMKRIDSLIGAGTTLTGNIVFTGGLRIDGNVIGSVHASNTEASTLVISEQARVEGEIRVSHLVINGEVDGPVHATDYLELQPKARVKGDIHYLRLEMHVGANVDGRLVVEGPAVSSVVELKRLTSSTGN
ncbi:MAG: polymer-forming cytoskeletal protein [Betaproteobacteria bacterium]